MQDIRHALRAFAARPGFTLVALLTLALGIGANTAVFTVVDNVLLQPLPYQDASRLAILTERMPQFPSLSVSWQNYVDWRDRSRSFEGFGAVRTTSLTLTGSGEAERLPAKMMTATLLGMLGVSPVSGRPFSADEDRAGAAPVALVSHGLWQRRFGGDPSLVGRTVVLDNEPCTVVGILPPGFQIMSPADVYLPLGPWAAKLPDDRGWHVGIFPIARLGPGVTLQQAQVEMDAISQQLASEYPQFNSKVGAQVRNLQDQIVQNVRPALLVLLAAVSAVLIIACANVANLLLSRAVGRQKEIAVRSAIGAGRRRLIRQLLVESVVLSGLGGLAGLLVAVLGVDALTALAGTSLPRAETVSVDWRVLVFALVVSIATGLVFGIVPALQTTRVDLREALNQDGRGAGTGAAHRRIRSVLVVAEIALALVLLVTAGLLLRSFAKLQQVEPGFDTANLLVVDLPLSPVKYSADTTRNQAVRRVIDRARALPGVNGAAVTTTLPMAGGGAMLHFNIAGRPPKGPEDYTVAGFRAVSPGYFEAMRIPLRRGRLFGDSDREDAPPIAVINESMARQFFPGADPIGQRLQLGTEPDTGSPTMEVVGVVGDVKQSFDSEAKAEMFSPYGQPQDPVLAGMYRNISLVVRTAGDPLGSAASLRRVLTELDADQPLVKLRTMEQSMVETVAQPRFRTVLLGTFALVALVLAIVGVYGVMAYGVSQRSQEIAVRVALGASKGQVVGMVVRQGLALVGAGIGLGLVGAVLAARAVSGLLFSVSGFDPLTFAGAALLIAGAALAASYVPARRAAVVSPTLTLGR